MYRKNSKLMMASTAFLLTVVVLSAFGVQDTQEPKRAELPQLIALRFHANWCGPCAKLAPSYDALKTAFQDKSVLFLTLDFTDTPERKQSEYLAGTLGLEDIWRDNSMTTGRILIIDRESKKIVSTFSSTQQLAEMKKALSVLTNE